MNKEYEGNFYTDWSEVYYKLNGLWFKFDYETTSFKRYYELPDVEKIEIYKDSYKLSDICNVYIDSEFIEIVNKQFPNIKSKDLNETQQLIAQKCDELKEMLLEKNRKYGNSALKPIRIFSQCDSTEQLYVRIDDKLSRIKNRQNDEDEDPILDVIGYMILLLISLESKKND